MSEVASCLGAYTIRESPLGFVELCTKIFANYAQQFQRLCTHFLPIMHAFFANYVHIMRTFSALYYTQLAINNEKTF